MADIELGTVVGHIRKLAAFRAAQEMTDRQLLEGFLAHRDDAAFSAVVKRHGPLVLAVCRRVLHHQQDAEDAFQATFLVLAQNAASIRKTKALAGWLHGVAYRLALKARRDAARRRVREREVKPVANSNSSCEHAWPEVQAILDEEIQRLPERYRAIFVLCCLEGKNSAAVGKELGLKEGTVRSRLSQARKQLRQRLARRGVTLSALLGATALAGGATRAAVPAALAAATVRSALFLAAQGMPVAGVVSAEVAALVRSAAKAMFLSKIKTLTVLVLAAGLVAAGAGMLAHQAPAPQQVTRSRTDSAKAKDQWSDPPGLAAGNQVRTDGYGDPLPPGAIARVGSMRFRQGSQIYCLAFSHDGRFVASGSFHGDLCLWDRTTGKLLRRFVDPSGDTTGVTAVAFSPDGRVLASNKGKAGLWEVGSGKLLRYLDRSSFGVALSMAFSPDGHTLALGTGKGIWLYDAATDKTRQPIPQYGAIVPVVVFSKDGKLLASGSTDKTARIWDLSSGKELRRFDCQDRVVDVALAPDSQLLAAQTTKEVLLCAVATGKEVHRFQAERHFRSLAFSPDGSRLASANAVWDVTSGKELCRIEGVPASGLAWGMDGKTLLLATGGWRMITGALAFAPDGKTLATGGCDGVVRLHDPATGKELAQANNSPWNRGTMAVCGFDPSGRWLAVRDYGGIHLCETASGQKVHRLRLDTDSGVSQCFASPVAFAPDGKMVVAADARVIYQWDTASGKELRRVPCPTNPQDLRPSAALAFAPDGRTFASAHHQSMIRLWDTATLKELRQFKDHESGVYQLFYFPDGKRLASQSFEGTVRIWDIPSGREHSRWSAPRQGILAFSPDGKLVVVDVADAEPPALALCDLATGKELRRISGIKANSCAFSADGRLLAVDADPVRYPDGPRTIQLLELASAQVRTQFAGQFGFPGQMVFSPDGKRLATGSSDSTALIWDVTGRLSDGRLRPEQLSARQVLETLSSGAPEARLTQEANAALERVTRKGSR